MERFFVLAGFISASQGDCRISKGHIALFTALFVYWDKQGFPDKLRVFSREIMPYAKISANSTYHRLLNQLSEYGYLGYKPSFNKEKGSLVSLDRSQQSDHQPVKLYDDA